jgi:hypothetical protein
MTYLDIRTYLHRCENRISKIPGLSESPDIRNKNISKTARLVCANFAFRGVRIICFSNQAAKGSGYSQ